MSGWPLRREPEDSHHGRPDRSVAALAHPPGLPCARRSRARVPPAAHAVGELRGHRLVALDALDERLLSCSLCWCWAGGGGTAITPLFRRALDSAGGPRRGVARSSRCPSAGRRRRWNGPATTRPTAGRVRLHRRGTLPQRYCRTSTLFLPTPHCHWLRHTCTGVGRRGAGASTSRRLARAARTHATLCSPGGRRQGGDPCQALLGPPQTRPLLPRRPRTPASVRGYSTR